MNKLKYYVIHFADQDRRIHDMLSSAQRNLSDVEELRDAGPEKENVSASFAMTRFDIDICALTMSLLGNVKSIKN